MPLSQQSTTMQTAQDFCVAAPEFGPLPESWSPEVYAVAEALRRGGRHMRLRELTIILPIDHIAIAAIDLACKAISEGGMGPSTADLERLLGRIAANPDERDRFLPALRSTVRRIAPSDRTY